MSSERICFLLPTYVFLKPRGDNVELDTKNMSKRKKKTLLPKSVRIATIVGNEHLITSLVDKI